MLTSTAEEMNPTRRNTMEDVHVIHPSGTWGAPNPLASFIGVYDGHGGRLIVDYLEDYLHRNVAKEWVFEMKKREEDNCSNDSNDGGGGEKEGEGMKKRHLSDIYGSGNNDNDSTDDDEEEDEGQSIRNSLERAFLLTDIQSRMAGLTTSGATVVCTVIVPKVDNAGNCTEIGIHAANAGDARAVLSSTVAHSASVATAATTSGSGNAVRITHDHKATDETEIERIKSVGGNMIRNRVLGIMAVARSLGDHGLKEFVIAKPYLSSTVVKVKCNAVNDDDGSSKGGQQQTNNQITYTNGEFLIVACDGLWDVMEDDEAVDLVRGHVAKNGLATRPEVASILVNEALERGSTDNITVVVSWL